MIKFNDANGENIKKHNPHQTQIHGHSYRILKILASGSIKTNLILNLKSYQPDIEKPYLYAEDPYEAKYKQLINKHKNVLSSHCNSNPKAFIECTSDKVDTCESIDK